MKEKINKTIITMMDVRFGDCISMATVNANNWH
jgi:hypothetical protein